MILEQLWDLFLRDIYTPIWPNIAASAIVYFFVRLKLNAMKDVQKIEAELRQQELKDHVADLFDPTTPGGITDVLAAQNGHNGNLPETLDNRV